MVTFQRDQGYDKLKEHEAIPYGFLKLLAATIVVLILIGNALRIIVWLGENGYPATGFGVAGSLVLVIIAFVLSGSRREWIKQYFSKNVRGFIVRYWIGLTETGEQILMCDVMRRGEEIDKTNSLARPKQVGLMMIEIPLGGWFKSPGVASLEVSNYRFLKAWRVREIAGRYFRGEVQLRFKYTYVLFKYEDRVTFSLYDAILLLSESAQNFLGDKCYDPAQICADLLKEAQRSEDRFTQLKDDRDRLDMSLSARIRELESSVTEAMEKRTAVLYRLNDILGQLNATTRLRATLEGARLRVAILEILTGKNGFHPGSVEYGDLDVELPGARAEVERLSRRRSGRGSADAAQAATPAPSA